MTLDQAYAERSRLRRELRRLSRIESPANADEARGLAIQLAGVDEAIAAMLASRLNQ